MVGAITQMNQGDPDGCVAPAGAIEFSFTSGGESAFFVTRYFFEGAMRTLEAAMNFLLISLLIVLFRT